MGRSVYERQHESLLVGYEDPRMEKYFDKATGSDATSLIDYKGTYKGIRQGTGFSHKNYNGTPKVPLPNRQTPY